MRNGNVQKHITSNMITKQKFYKATNKQQTNGINTHENKTDSSSYNQNWY